MAPTRSALRRSSPRAEAIDATAALQLCASSVRRGGVVSTSMAQLGSMANIRNNYPHQHEDHPLRVRGCRGQQSRRRCRRNWKLKRRKRLLDESSTQVSSDGSSPSSSIEGPPQGPHDGSSSSRSSRSTMAAAVARDEAEKLPVSHPVVHNPSLECTTCGCSFSSRNKLFAHLREVGHASSTSTSSCHAHHASLAGAAISSTTGSVGSVGSVGSGDIGAQQSQCASPVIGSPAVPVDLSPSSPPPSGVGISAVVLNGPLGASGASRFNDMGAQQSQFASPVIRSPAAPTDLWSSSVAHPTIPAGISNGREGVSSVSSVIAKLHSLFGFIIAILYEVYGVALRPSPFVSMGAMVTNMVISFTAPVMASVFVPGWSMMTTTSDVLVSYLVVYRLFYGLVDALRLFYWCLSTTCGFIQGSSVQVMGALYDIYTVHGKKKRKRTKPLKVGSKQWNKEVAARWSHVWDILAQKGFAGPVPRLEYELRTAQQSYDCIQSISQSRIRELEQQLTDRTSECHAMIKAFDDVNHDVKAICQAAGVNSLSALRSHVSKLMAIPDKQP